MKKIFISLSVVLLFTAVSCHKNSGPQYATTGGAEMIQFRALPFEITDVKLLDGPFLRATRLDSAILLNYDADRLLSRFYTEAGLKPKAEPYGGWESESLAGHSLGHYLSACAQMYQTTGDTVFRGKVNYIVSELAAIQQHDSSGYIGAMPAGKKVFENELKKGNIRSRGFDLNGIWSPMYTMHKVMAGLRDSYRLCGNKQALLIEVRFADWLGSIFKPLSDEQMQEVLRCEHGGICETLADLYADTKEERFLVLAEKLYHREILDAMKQHKDILPGKHCNTNIPKLIALSRIYELTGDTSDRGAAEYFWKMVVNKHSYATGGNGNDEYFGAEGKLRDRLGEGTTETCNVYNMLKLSEHLFEWDADAAVADFYERALINHILASQDPANGHVTYNLSLDMGGFKDFQDPYSFTCCVGSGMENHSKYSKNIYYHNDNELFIFQFIASQLTWKEKGITLVQNTSFPKEQGTELTVHCKDPVTFSMQIRYPGWAGNGATVEINGSQLKTRAKSGSFITITRKFREGDRIKVKFPFSLHLEPMPDDSDRVAIMYGPLVMAGDLGPVKDSTLSDPDYVPVLMTDKRDPSLWLVKSTDGENTFTTKNTGGPRDVKLVPFYEIHDRRYTIYWDLFDEKSWEARSASYRLEKEQQIRLREATIDFFKPGEMQPERDHNFKSEKSSIGMYKERSYRDTRDGWFSFVLKVNPGKPAALAAEYWGGFPGAKTFDILVNDTVIATENISNKKEGQFITIVYDIPQQITAKRNSVTVKFVAKKGNMAGPLFGARTIKKQ